MDVTKLDKFFYAVLLMLLAVSTYIGFSYPDYFDNDFAQEDGIVEYGTTFMLLAIALLCLYRVITRGKGKKASWIMGTLLFCLLFLFGAGEEISWGQRLFHIESSDFFRKNNAQQETNLHNLVVADKKINKIVFSQLLMIVMVIYLLGLPYLYRKKEWVSSLADRFAVPVVKWHHTIAFILSTVIIVILPNSRKWEVYELIFGLLFLLIFLRPLNQDNHSGLL